MHDAALCYMEQRRKLAGLVHIPGSPVLGREPSVAGGCGDRVAPGWSTAVGNLDDGLGYLVGPDYMECLDSSIDGEHKAVDWHPHIDFG